MSETSHMNESLTQLKIRNVSFYYLLLNGAERTVKSEGHEGERERERMTCRKGATGLI